MLLAALWDPQAHVERVRPPWKELGHQGVATPFLLARGLRECRALWSWTYSSGHRVFPPRTPGSKELAASPQCPWGRPFSWIQGALLLIRGTQPLIQGTQPLIQGGLLLTWGLAADSGGLVAGLGALPLIWGALPLILDTLLLIQGALSQKLRAPHSEDTDGGGWSAPGGRAQR